MLNQLEDMTSIELSSNVMALKELLCSLCSPLTEAEEQCAIAHLALGIDPDQVDDIAKNMWRFSASSFRNALKVKPELAEPLLKQVEQRQGDEPVGRHD